MKRRGLVTGIVVLIVLAIVYSRQSSQRARHLSFVPPAMDVTEILYVAEESWGFGPGGNEMGIIVYEMPQSTRTKIKQQGIPWLNELSGGGTGLRGQYSTWHVTPFDPSLPRSFDIWAMEKRAETCEHGGGIAGYMFRFSPCIAFDAEVEALANGALSAPNSYYAFGRIGMLLLIPERNRIIYAYSG